MKVAILLCTLLPMAFGQQVGTNTAEQHLPLPLQVCSGPGSCTSEQTTVTIDSNWRWTHKVNDFVNCYTGNTWDATLCPDTATCTQNCALDGVDQATWTGTYGVTAQNNGINIKFVTNGPFSKNIGSRVYLLASETKYKMFQLLNREFSMDVDVSNLPCGLNGAVYFVEMEEDGGMSSYPTNKAGAKYGTGYCDAQCPHDMKWIAGEANVEGWNPAPDDPNSGAGKKGICCFEMDIWEANSQAQSFTPHPCEVDGYYPCEGTECGDNGDDRYAGVCDKDGCDFAAYRLGAQDFYGTGKTIDTSKPFTLITQFITSDGSDNGDLVEIKRIWRQDGREIANVEGSTGHDSITEDYCTAVKDAFGDINDFANKGGLRNMGQALKRGMVLALSLWDDHYAHMHWLDAVYPDGGTAPGNLRGPCPPDGGDPAELENSVPNSSVTFSNLKIGPIGSL
jgi:cellulose 1,4-beta-cellobiosidase